MTTKQELKYMAIYCVCGHSKYRHLNNTCYGAIHGNCKCKKFKIDKKLTMTRYSIGV